MEAQEHSQTQNLKLINPQLEYRRQEYITRFGKPVISLIYGQYFNVKIETKNLVMESVRKDDAYFIHKYLWGQEKVMSLFATGTTKTFQDTEKRVDMWVKRWKQEIPYSAVAIRSRANSDFIGYVVMGLGGESESSEIAYLIREDLWNKGLGYESVGAVSLFLSQVLIRNQFRINQNKEEFKRVIATSNILNIASQKLLQKCGFKIYGQTQKFGFQRYEYELNFFVSPKPKIQLSFPQCQNNYINKYGLPIIQLAYQSSFSAQINTKNLLLKSVQLDDAFLIHKYLWGNPKVMRLFGTGQTRSFQQTEKRVQIWTKRWEDGIPFAALTVRSRVKDEFLGYVVMGFGSQNNSSEIAYAIRSDKWNNGYGYEAVGAITLFLSKVLVKHKSKVNGNDQFKRVIATSHKHNIYSIRILEKCGFRQEEQIMKYGTLRNQYQLNVQ